MLEIFFPLLLLYAGALLLNVSGDVFASAGFLDNVLYLKRLFEGVFD